MEKMYSSLNFKQHLSIVNSFISIAANVEALSLEQHTPMHYAVRGGSVDCTKILIDNGSIMRLLLH